MIRCYIILILYFSKCSLQNVDFVDQNNLRIVKAGDSVHLTCVFTKGTRSSVAWIKQNVGVKPLIIAASTQALPATFENDFDKCRRFSVIQDDGSFNLSIQNVEEPDTATYYCVKYLYKFIFEEGTDLIVNDAQLSSPAGHQRPVMDPVHQEDSAGALQCSILTESCAGEQNVYWFRHQSGESPPGIIYTQKNFNGQCKRSSETNSTTQTCIYNLPRRNFSHYDDGIYYCAVAMCGKILFGDGRKPDTPGLQMPWIKAVFVLATTNSLSVIVIMILGAQLYKLRQKDGIHNTQLGQLMTEDTDALNYAALSFSQNPSTSRRPKGKKTQDNSVYAHVRHK